MSNFPGGVCRGLPKHFAYCKALGKRYTGISTEAKKVRCVAPAKSQKICRKIRNIQ